MAVGEKWGRKSNQTQITVLPLNLKCGPLCLSFLIDTFTKRTHSLPGVTRYLAILCASSKRALPRGRSLWTPAGKKVTSLAHHRGAPLKVC